MPKLLELRKKTKKVELIPSDVMNKLKKLVNKYVDNKDEITALENENADIKAELEKYIPDEGLIIGDYIVTKADGRVTKSVDYEKFEKKYPDIFKLLVKFRKGSSYLKIQKNTGNYSLFKK